MSLARPQTLSAVELSPSLDVYSLKGLFHSGTYLGFISGVWPWWKQSCSILQTASVRKGRRS